MSPTTLAMLRAIQRDGNRDRSRAFFGAIENGDTPKQAHWYLHPRVFYSPLQLLQFSSSRGRYGCYGDIARAAVAS